MGVSSVAPSTVSGPTQCHDKPNSDGRQLDKAHCPPRDDRGWLFPKRCGGGVLLLQVALLPGIRTRACSPTLRNSSLPHRENVTRSSFHVGDNIAC